MAQAGRQPSQAGVIEQSYGRYTVRVEGNSATVTVPRAFPLASGTQIQVRAGWVDEKLVYLKAIPLTALLNGSPGTEKTSTTENGVEITEADVDMYCVRGGKSEDKSITIPSKCDTERFPEKSKPVVVSGRTGNGVAYLRLIPECVYSATESTDISEIAHVISEDSFSS